MGPNLTFIPTPNAIRFSCTKEEGDRLVVIMDLLDERNAFGNAATRNLIRHTFPQFPPYVKSTSVYRFTVLFVAAQRQWYKRQTQNLNPSAFNPEP